MVSNVRDFFKAERRYDPRLEGVTGTYRFDIQAADHWYVWRVAVNDGNVDVSQGTADADCVIGCSEEDFIRIASGEQNLITATLQGRVEVAGDLALAQKLHALLRSKPQETPAEKPE
ncbi:MAG: SCP2 sterol-binding domain-containing protein [Phycisphaerales bacterium]|nr:SCP2 sterol-binding domain-containing protein [Phycisphaerales bacterium]MCI0674414.1 SCP2 sterol-binding domain-containing protein [Phycisphaerales bacterium]